ncbi:MAG: hypothetical protein IJY56_00965 [Clostridia bacterium]|nr:hypothetical protein [Clostridia bacterium]
MSSERSYKKLRDTLICDGDYLTDADGLPKDASEDALLQMMYICLAVKKGSFCLDPLLGSELYTLRGMTSDERKLRVVPICAEALERIEGLLLTGASISETDGLLHVSVSARLGEREKEVCICL